MEELTMLLQLAGGEQEAARRLRAAGFRKAKDLARASVGDLRAKGGLSAAASRRLIRAAQDLIAPRQSRKVRSPRSGLIGLPATSASETARSSARDPTPAKVVGQGVNKAESLSLTGDTPREERTSRSFWRFG